MNSTRKMFVSESCLCNQSRAQPNCVSYFFVYLCKLLVVNQFCSPNQKQNPVSQLVLCLHINIVSSQSWLHIRTGSNPRFSIMQKLLRNLQVYGLFTVKIIDFYAANAMKIGKPFQNRSTLILVWFSVNLLISETSRPPFRVSYI